MPYNHTPMPVPSQIIDNNQIRQPRISIVIPVYNKLEFTKECLRALQANTPPHLYEIVIVDNASSDRTDKFLKEISSSVQTISNQVNQGFARACNQGADTAQADLVLFLNNDTEPQPGWLEPLLHILDNNPEIAAVGSKLLYPD
ncbi:MAG: glycosyltransferase family 2 protein, partial [Geobacteraceae bacterium]|nr:glycosyltransferase family 2 protein [Geobacteraceae bacterium]